MPKTNANARSFAGRGADYASFAAIDGRHPYKKAVPDGFVDYPARTRHGGEVFFFNFDLAKEIGLLPEDHEHVMNKALSDAVLEAFSLQIINEYDQLHKTPIPKQDIRPHRFMATRYLQLQHPDKRGITSGDGRGIWNGYFKNAQGVVWDITSCGTGATRLSPATAIEERFFKTGENVQYGGGRADLEDGLGAALTSEVFHYNGIPTERTLALIAYRDGSSVNVRAAPNLLRPAHFFAYLKQNDHQALKGVTDYYVERQVANGELRRGKTARQTYERFLRRIARDFARAAALYEMEYIFVWMDWDGDNILCDGGIIDYGSVRQFGLFHYEYRYDDVSQYSTSIVEQRRKARYIVQTFAQLIDFVIEGKKTNIKQFRKHPVLRLFDDEFAAAKIWLLLYKMGFAEALIEALMDDREAQGLAQALAKDARYFEKVKAHRGPYQVSDGITWDAVFCLRDILRELPVLYQQQFRDVRAAHFVNILRSAYATDADVAPSPHRLRKVREFQRHYRRLVERAQALSGCDRDQILHQMAQRSALINRHERVTGDGLIYATQRLLRAGKTLGGRELHKLFDEFVHAQILRPEMLDEHSLGQARLRNREARRTLERMLEAVRENREGI